MKKYGFVYIWFDCKHKRYYIGCHWGNVDDGYICSSSNMKSAYKRRPENFKRKILIVNITNKQDLLEAEYKWLSKIKTEELGKRYYNLHNHHFNHWSTNEQTKLTVSQKISASPLRNKRISEANKGKIISEEHKQKLREFNKRKLLSKEHKEKCRIANKGKTPWNKGITQTKEHKENISNGLKKDPLIKIRNKIAAIYSHYKRGHKVSEENIKLIRHML